MSKKSKKSVDKITRNLIYYKCADEKGSGNDLWKLSKMSKKEFWVARLNLNNN